MNYGKLYAVILLLLIVSGCGGSNDIKTEIQGELLEDVLTLVLTFGAEDLDTEYILAQPSFDEGVGIDAEGNILVVDEDYVKVFGPEGSPKRLVGGSGEGPGDFSRPQIIWMSVDGYFSVLDGFSAHHFRPDFTFIERTDFRFSDSFQEVLEEDNLIPQEFEAVYSLGETERVYAISVRDVDRQNYYRKEVFLFHQNTDSLRIITNYPQSNFVASPQGRTVTSGSWGNLLVAPLPGNRIVYLHSYHDTEISEEGGVSYRLIIHDLDSMRQRYIDHLDPAYTPVGIYWEPMTYPEEYRENNPVLWQRTLEMNRLVEEFVAERKYDCPVTRLYSDDDYIFVFTNTRNDSSDVKVDVFDVERGYLRSAWFSAGFGYIRDGHLYKVSNYYSGEEFPQIEKYRIDQRVYRNQ